MCSKGGANFFGPGSSTKNKLNTPLEIFIQNCSRYVYNLDDLKRYCVWRYTIGSASVNKLLIFGSLGENSDFWTYLFFKYAYNNKISVEDSSLKNYARFIHNPNSYNELNKGQKLKIAGDVIGKYIKILQEIILRAPIVPKGGFHTYKVASIYPDLPSVVSSSFKSKIVPQLPFNSTTISPQFNFAPFISPTAESVFFDIFIPEGNNVLFIPTDLHAYPFETEILLPFGCAFDIFKVEKGILDYIDPANVNIIQVQDKDNALVGNIYNIDEYKPCLNGNCLIQRKQFDIFTCVYIPPP